MGLLKWLYHEMLSLRVTIIILGYRKGEYNKIWQNNQKYVSCVENQHQK